MEVKARWIPLGVLAFLVGCFGGVFSGSPEWSVLSWVLAAGGVGWVILAVASSRARGR